MAYRQPAYNPQAYQGSPAANQYQHQQQQQQPYHGGNIGYGQPHQQPHSHAQQQQPYNPPPQQQQQQQQPYNPPPQQQQPYNPPPQQQQPYNPPPQQQQHQQHHQQQKQRQQQQQQQKQQQRQPQPARGRQPKVKERSEISLVLKYVLFFVNLKCWIVGLLLIGIGVWGWHDRGALDGVETLDSIVQSPIVDPSWWLVILGSIIFLIAASGCIGALRENTFLLNIYKISLILVLLLEIGGGVAIYFYADEIEDQFAKTLLTLAIPGYRENPDFQDLIDVVQTELRCCGVNGYNDWDTNLYFDCSNAEAGRYTNPEACGVPFSCCKLEPDSPVLNTQCGYGARLPANSNNTASLYTAGCVQNFKYWLIERFDLIAIATVGGVVLVVEFLACGLAQSLIASIQRQKSRW